MQTALSRCQAAQRLKDLLSPSFGPLEHQPKNQRGGNSFLKGAWLRNQRTGKGETQAGRGRRPSGRLHLRDCGSGGSDPAYLCVRGQGISSAAAERSHHG